MPTAVPAPAPAARAGRPEGVVTRGTTGANRLRRLDRWLTGPGAGVLRAAADPLVVDLGFGASATTTLELAARLRRTRPDVEVVGLEVDPARVRRAQEQLAALRAAGGPTAAAGVRFAGGGFELASGAALAGRRPVLVRAANVLRQYPQAAVAPAWERVCAHLAPGGLLVDATCDEVGRRAAWLAVRAEPGGPRPLALVVSLRLAGLERPGAVAERLPKALIHRNVPGEGVHAWLAALDDAWARSAPHAAFGVRQRWVATAAALAGAGWPVTGGLLGGPGRWRLGEVAVAAEAVL